LLLYKHEARLDTNYTPVSQGGQHPHPHPPFGNLLTFLLLLLLLLHRIHKLPTQSISSPTAAIRGKLLGGKQMSFLGHTHLLLPLPQPVYFIIYLFHIFSNDRDYKMYKKKRGRKKYGKLCSCPQGGIAFFSIGLVLANL